MPKDILILTTGGTIDKIYFDAKSVFRVGEPQIAKILSTANVTVRYEVDTLLRKDSMDLTAEDRALIVRRALEARHRHILITHGTDTMIKTARALRDISGKTIVLVGSLTPAQFKATDAEFNIGFAMAAVQTLPHGVYLAMNGCIFDPLRVRKNSERNRFEIS